MPRISKWIADLVENTFSGKFREVTVTATQYLTPHLKKITFSGDISNVKFEPGYAVLMRIDDTNFRNYTPCRWDAEAGNFDILFHIHGNGPGSKYIDDLDEQDVLTISVPRGYKLFRKDSASHFFFGDESTLGLFKGMKEQADKMDASYTGIFELDHVFTGIEALFGVGKTETVSKSGVPAQHAVHLLHELTDTQWKEWEQGTFYLMGNAKSIQHFRKALKERGIPARNIVTQPYWAEGKIGL